MNQIKSGLKDIPTRKSLNYSGLIDARRLLLKKIESVALGSDTIIIAESYVNVKVAYWCTLYASNTNEIKRYRYVSDNYNKRPIVYYLKEEKVSGFEITEIQSIQTDIHSYLEKIGSKKTAPGIRYYITSAIKINGKYVFQYFSADTN